MNFVTRKSRVRSERKRREDFLAVIRGRTPVFAREASNSRMGSVQVNRKNCTELLHRTILGRELAASTLLALEALYKSWIHETLFD